MLPPLFPVQGTAVCMRNQWQSVVGTKPGFQTFSIPVLPPLANRSPSPPSRSGWCTPPTRRTTSPSPPSSPSTTPGYRWSWSSWVRSSARTTGSKCWSLEGCHWSAETSLNSSFAATALTRRSIFGLILMLSRKCCCWWWCCCCWYRHSVGNVNLLLQPWSRFIEFWATQQNRTVGKTGDPGDGTTIGADQPFVIRWTSDLRIIWRFECWLVLLPVLLLVWLMLEFFFCWCWLGLGENQCIAIICSGSPVTPMVGWWDATKRGATQPSSMSSNLLR